MSRAPRIALGGHLGAGKTTLALALPKFHKAALADQLKYLASRFLGRPIQKGTDRELLQRLNVGRDPAWAFVSIADTEADEAHAAARLADHLDWRHKHFPGLDRIHGYEWFQAVQRLREALYEDPQPFSHGFGAPDYWVNRLLEELEGIPEAMPIVIDDLRRCNEAEALKREGFTLVRVETPLAICQARIEARDGHWDDAWLRHESERELHDISWDLVVLGTGDAGANAKQLLGWVKTHIASSRSSHR